MKTIALFIHQPKCSVQSGNGIIRALGRDYRFKIFTRHELEDSFFDDVDIVAIPGGVGDSDSYDYLMKIHGQSIRNFVAGGGYYLGMCLACGLLVQAVGCLIYCVTLTSFNNPK